MKIYTADQQFPQPIGQHISQITEKNYCMKLPFLSQTCIYLFEFSNINSRIKWNIYSKLTKEAPDNIFDKA